MNFPAPSFGSWHIRFGKQSVPGLQHARLPGQMVWSGIGTPEKEKHVSAVTREGRRARRSRGENASIVMFSGGEYIQEPEEIPEEKKGQRKGNTGYLC